MIIKCALDPALNNCEFYDRSSSNCISKKQGCSYRIEETDDKKIQAPRKEKWFEKYM